MQDSGGVYRFGRGVWGPGGVYGFRVECMGSGLSAWGPGGEYGVRAECLGF